MEAVYVGMFDGDAEVFVSVEEVGVGGIFKFILDVSRSLICRDVVLSGGKESFRRILF